MEGRQEVPCCNPGEVASRNQIGSGSPPKEENAVGLEAIRGFDTASPAQILAQPGYSLSQSADFTEVAVNPAACSTWNIPSSARFRTRPLLRWCST